MRALVVMLWIACLAAGAWFLFDSRDAAPRPTLEPAAATNATDHANPVDAAVENATPTPAVAPNVADASQREAVTPLPAGPSGEVLVVRFGSNEPIADADVYCWPPDLDWSKLSPELQKLAREDQDALLRRISPSLHSDAQGRCRVPLGDGDAEVTAEKGELWGKAYVRKDQGEPTVLVMGVDHTLHVLVVDAGGRPTPDVMVVAESKPGDEPRAWQFDKTDAAGRLERKHVQTLASDAVSAMVDVLATIPGGESERVRIDFNAPPAEVVLQLPPSGTVTVHVRDADGRAIDPTLLGNPVVRLLTYAEKPANLRAESEGEQRSNPGEAAIDANGDANFRAVVLGRYLVAKLAWSARTSVVPGPTLLIPHVEMTVRENPDEVVLVGTLLAPEGTPLVRSQFYVACQLGRSLSGTNARTDDAGRFRVNMSDYPGGKSATVSFDTGAMGSQDAMAIELPPRPVTKGTNALGTLQLQRHTVLVQGTVVATTGNPPPRPRFTIERQRNDHWQREWQLQPRWSDDQSFTVRGGISKGTPMRLVVDAPGFLPVEPIEFAAGATGLEVTLRQGGSASATFLVDADVPVASLQFRLRRADEVPANDPMLDLLQQSGRSTGEAKDGMLQANWTALQDGRYQLTAMCKGVPAALVTIDDIMIADGPCTDPRLTGIDLRGRVRAFEIRATDTDGTAIVSSDAFVLVRGDDQHWNGFHLGNGVAKLAAPAAIDLIVVAKNHKTAVVNGVFESRTIALEAAPAIQVTAALPSPLPEGAALQLDLMPKLGLPPQAQLTLDNGRGLMLQDFFVEEFRVDANGKADFVVRFPGPYSIAAAVQPAGRARLRGVDVEPHSATLPGDGELNVKIREKDFARAIAGDGR